MNNREYLYYPNGEKKAILVHILESGECPCNWEKKTNHFTQGNKVYRTLIDKDDEKFVFPDDLDAIK